METVYACRRCRTPLFRPSLLTSHAAGAQSFSYRRVKKDAKDAAAGGGGADAAAAALALDAGGGGGGGGGSAGEGSRMCTSHFLAEAVQWMESASKDIEGKLNCPGCGARLGTLAWAGSQCSCGSWVNPAIQIQKKAVEEKRVYPAAGAAGAADGAPAHPSPEASAPG
jgi:dual specificity phosphatase 12